MAILWRSFRFHALKLFGFQNDNGSFTFYVDFFSFLYHYQDFDQTCICDLHGVCLKRSRNFWAHSGFLVGSVLFVILVFCVFLLCFITFSVPCCDVRDNICIKWCLYFQLFVGGVLSYLSYFFCLRIMVSKTYRAVIFVLFYFVLCLVYIVLPIFLDCPFLIAPSVSLPFISEVCASDEGYSRKAWYTLNLIPTSSLCR